MGSDTGMPANPAAVPAPATRMGAAAPGPAPERMDASSRAGRQPGHAASAKTGAPKGFLAGSLASVPWKRAMLTLGLAVVAVVVLVIVARWLRTTPDVQSFLGQYPGHPTLPDTVPTGLPGWLGWQHFFNIFFMVLIVRTGLQIRHEKKAPAHWTPEPNSLFSPKGSTPKKVSLTQWLHQALDILWVANGLVFIVLLFATSQWMRIVPTDWDVVPNALSAMLQYASLEWPTENGWIYYNALQMLAYFSIVFLAAPLAVISGIRFSTWWPDQNSRLSRIYPIEVARAVHYPVMLYFVAFTLVHVFLVFFTGALRNLNHMYASRDEADWLGLGVFVVSVLVTGAAWILTKPLFMRPVAGRFGTLSK